MPAGLETIEFRALAYRTSRPARSVMMGWPTGFDSRVYRSHGRKSVNTVPWQVSPSLDLTRRTPRCRSMISLLIHNPRPVPCAPFVEKNGSKILDKLCREIPGPVSATVTSTPRLPVGQCIADRLRTRRRPPCVVMASIAFPTRLFKTCRTSPSRQVIEGDVRLRRSMAISA